MGARINSTEGARSKQDTEQYDKMRKHLNTSGAAI
jgi:hypothetical protein